MGKESYIYEVWFSEGADGYHSTCKARFSDDANARLMAKPYGGKSAVTYSGRVEKVRVFKSIAEYVSQAQPHDLNTYEYCLTTDEKKAIRRAQALAKLSSEEREALGV